MIYVVMGMHKSGTSLVAETLHHSDVAMVTPEDVEGTDGYDSGNKHERREVWYINDEILGSRGVESIDIRPPRKLRVSAALRRRMSQLIERLSVEHEDWGFKDPRLCFTYPAWAEVLPAHRLIGVYRPLYELAYRYKGDRSLRRALKVVRAWHDNNEHMMSHLKRSGHDWILLHYGRLMEGDAELRRLGAFLGRTLVDRRQPALRRGTGAAGWRMRLAEGIHRATTGRRASECLARLDELSTLRGSARHVRHEGCARSHPGCERSSGSLGDSVARRRDR